MKNSNKLSETQGKVLNFLNDYFREMGFPPTLREIASYFGLKGPKAPQKTLKILEKKGYIRRSPEARGRLRCSSLLLFPKIEYSPSQLLGG